MIEYEVSFKLNKDYSYYYYDNLLKSKGLNNTFNCITHDMYYTNKDLDGMSEDEMKNACIRLRSINNKDYVIQNNLIDELDNKKVSKFFLKGFEKKLLKYGYKKVFDTIKSDHHYCNDNMKSKIQLQEIKDIGLLLYYDNSDYFEYDVDTQKRKLIDELNSYGFKIYYDELCFDKLRTLYYKKDMFN